MDRIEGPGLPEEITNEVERKAYFQPFKDPGGRYPEKSLCGAARSRCSQCSRRYEQGERLLMTCPECGADRRCRNLSLENGRCKYHGGRSVSGELHPRYKNGTGARPLPAVFPKHVQDAYATAQRSSDMTSIIQEHGLVQARMLLVAGRLAGPEAERWWRDLDDLRKKIEVDRPAAQKGDAAAAGRVAGYVDAVLALIERGAVESDQWSEILKLNDKSAELKSKQAQIERDHSAVLSAGQAMEFVTLISRGVKEALLLVKDKVQSIRAALFDEVEIGGIIDESVDRIERGDDVREVISSAIGRLTDVVPLDEVDKSFVDADQIVKGRIRQLVE